MDKIAEIAGNDSDVFERWPGYSEQSWSERFAELDRRHRELRGQFLAFALRAHLNGE